MSHDRILRLPEVIQVTGISRSRIYFFMARETDPFPRSVQLGPNMVGWRSSEIEAWLAARERTDSIAQPH